MKNTCICYDDLQASRIFVIPAFSQSTKSQIEKYIRLTLYFINVIFAYHGQWIFFCNYFYRNGRGAWQTDGCTRIDVSSNQIVCQCNHLTNFAVLMSLDSDVSLHIFSVHSVYCLCVCHYCVRFALSFLHLICLLITFCLTPNQCFVPE